MSNFSWIGIQKLITLIVQVGVEPVKPFRKWPQLLTWFNYNPNMDK